MKATELGLEDGWSLRSLRPPGKPLTWDWKVDWHNEANVILSLSLPPLQKRSCERVFFRFFSFLVLGGQEGKYAAKKLKKERWDWVRLRRICDIKIFEGFGLLSNLQMKWLAVYCWQGAIGVWLVEPAFPCIWIWDLWCSYDFKDLQFSPQIKESQILSNCENLIFFGGGGMRSWSNRSKS